MISSKRREREPRMVTRHFIRLDDDVAARIATDEVFPLLDRIFRDHPFRGIDEHVREEHFRRSAAGFLGTEFRLGQRHEIR
jgi:hypothetical protein